MIVQNAPEWYAIWRAAFDFDKVEYFQLTETRLGLAASLGDSDRQPVERCLERLHRDQGAALQLFFETGQNLSNHFDHLGSTQAPQPHTNYGRP